ncbi:MAG: spindle associated, partial [Piptocephalis tieghemiana]
GRGDRAGQGKQAPLTLKEQESVIDHLTKDNFNLKLKISFLEERLMDMSPENMEKVLKENVEFKVRLQMVNSELESKNKLLMQ